MTTHDQAPSYPAQSYRAQITRSAWEVLSTDYRSGTPERGDTFMLRWTDDLGTVAVSVEVVDRPELFCCGSLLATPGALRAAESTGCPSLLAGFVRRHHGGDWGCLDMEDHEANDRALHIGGRLFSAYRADVTTWWVITEADRAMTTVLLPSEY